MKSIEQIKLDYQNCSTDYLKGILDENIQYKDYAQQMIDLIYDILSDRGEL